MPTSTGLGLSGRLAVVTGAAAGIGAGIAAALARHGAHLVLVDVDKPALEETCARLRASGVETVVAVLADVTHRDDVRRLAAAADATGDVEVLVNNVGDHRPWGPFVETTEEDWEAVLDLNLRHVLR